MTDEYAATHGPGALAWPETIREGDLIYYSYGWNPVTRDAVHHGHTVYVHFIDGTRRAPEWKQYDPRKRARVRRQIRSAEVAG